MCVNWTRRRKLHFRRNYTNNYRIISKHFCLRKLHKLNCDDGNLFRYIIHTVVVMCKSLVFFPETFVNLPGLLFWAALENNYYVLIIFARKHECQSNESSVVYFESYWHHTLPHSLYRWEINNKWSSVSSHLVLSMQTINRLRSCRRRHDRNTV